MKLVLDLLPQLIRRNPDEQAGQATKAAILNNLVSIVTGKSSKPLAKSAIKALDHLVTKDIVTLDEIRSSFATLQQKNASTDPLDLWKSFIFELFHWMTLHFVCPTAGRFIVCLYRGLRGQDQQETQIQLSIETWHKWLLEAINEEPSILESVKNYIFLPLFKADKAEALGFLKRMNEHEAVSAGDEIDLNLPALLQLAALEIGKKVGWVEEPGKSTGMASRARTNNDQHSAMTSPQIVTPQSSSMKKCWKVFWLTHPMKSDHWLCHF